MPLRNLDTAVSFEEDDSVIPSAPGRIGRAGIFDGKVFLNRGAVGRFDIDDRFSLSAWIYSDQIPDGSVMFRMVDNPKGKGSGVHLDQGRVHVNFTSTWADDAIRVETERLLEPKMWHHIAVTYVLPPLPVGAPAWICRVGRRPGQPFAFAHLTVNRFC